MNAARPLGDSHDPAGRVVAALEAGGWDPRPTGPSRWESRCPSHDGTRRNLSVAIGDSGAVILKCHHEPGCTAAQVVEALGLAFNDLFPRLDQPRSRPAPRGRTRVYRSEADALAAVARRLEAGAGGRVGRPTSWRYKDADGAVAMLVCRFDVPGRGKTYRPLAKVEGGYADGDPPGPLPLYNLDKLASTPGRVWLVEGEKCADAAESLGLLATTTAHGAGSPHKSDLTPLAGRDVVIVPDNDAEGEGYAAKAAGLLAGLTPPAVVRIVRLPELTGKGDDLADWVDAMESAGALDAEQIRGELARLADRARIVRAKRPAPPTREELNSRLATMPRTDLGNAERMAARYGLEARFCPPWGRWLIWDGRRYADDQTGAVDRLAKKTAREMLAEAATIFDDESRKAHISHARGSESRAKLEAMKSLAASEEGVPVLPAELDGDGWLFNCPNGTLDLRTGELRPHDREDLITQLCPVEFDPRARSPLWDATLKLFFGGDDRLIAYWQRLCGYALVGLIRDHVMPVAYGDGSNGKSTILGTLLEVFGPDYAMKAPASFLMAKAHDPHPTDRADLFRKRLVVAIETEDGRRLDETMVKELTGGDDIRARRMRENHWQFKPTHTLFMATNHRPTIRGTDHGIWRRLKLVPFSVKVDHEKADTTMSEKLRAEYPGILAWCVRGCLAWQDVGLNEPDSVKAATDAYRAEQDVLGTFIADRTIQAPPCRTRCIVLYNAYSEWAKMAGEHPITLKRFGQAMKERGFETKASNGKWYLGIGLSEAGEGEQPEGERPRDEADWGGAA